MNYSLRGFRRPFVDSPLCVIESRHKNLPYSNLRNLLSAECRYGTDHDDRAYSLGTDLFRCLGQGSPQRVLSGRRPVLDHHHRRIRRSAAFQQGLGEKFDALHRHQQHDRAGEIRSAAESAAVQNAVRAMELLIAAGDSLDPMVLKAVRLHLLAAGLFCVAAGSGAGEGIPNSEAGKRVM